MSNEIIKPYAITDFASMLSTLPNFEGKLLLICGKQYKAWNYDTYIYDAIGLAKRWKPKQITYDRIVHLRYWLRENIQHGHNLSFERIRSMKSIKLKIDDLIDCEYRYCDDDDGLKEMKQHDFEQNAAAFFRNKN